MTEFVDYYGVRRPADSWVVIIRPSSAKEKQIADDLRADGHNPNDSSTWYDVMENCVFVAYVKAKTKDEAKNIAMKRYNIYHEPWEYTVFVRANIGEKVYKEKIHVLNYKELREYLYHIY